MAWCVLDVLLSDTFNQDHLTTVRLAFFLYIFFFFLLFFSFFFFCLLSLLYFFCFFSFFPSFCLFFIFPVYFSFSFLCFSYFPIPFPLPCILFLYFSLFFSFSPRHSNLLKSSLPFSYFNMLSYSVCSTLFLSFVISTPQ